MVPENIDILHMCGERAEAAREYVTIVRGYLSVIFTFFPSQRRAYDTW